MPTCHPSLASMLLYPYITQGIAQGGTMRSIRLAAIILLVGGCLAACRGAAPETAKGAEEAMAAVKSALDDSDLSQLGRAADHLDGLPRDSFNATALQRRNKLMAIAAQKLLSAWAIRWVNDAQSNLPVTASIIASKDTNQANDNFRKALADVTEDAIRGETCKEILNYVAPNPNPTATVTPDNEDWQGNIVQDATNILAKTFNLTGVIQTVRWVNWSKDVVDSAQQASQAILYNPTRYQNFLSNPMGLRATYVYAKYCYAPPTGG